MRRTAAKRKGVGFSLVELIVALAVAVILAAIGLPVFLRAYRIYELNSAAGQMAGILRLARYEAIRLNKPVNCAVQSDGATPPTTTVWVDSNLDGNPDPTEKQVVFSNAGNLVGPPGTTPPISGQIGTLSVTTPSPSASSVQFDARGAVKPPTRVNVFYLSSAVAPEAGYRAVVLMPAGSIQIWMGDTSGNWQFQQ
jgi:prepilin-type N-terminal cleavage/methylation domain-containing protein